MKRVLRRAAAGLSAAMALWFALPMGVGIFDIANVTGVVGFLLLAAALLFWPRVRAWLGRLWERRGMRMLLAALGIVLAGLLVLTVVLVGKVIGAMRQPTVDADTVIVLGCQVDGERPSALLDHRIETAADYLKTHPSAVCIVSGGQGGGERITEAECMERGLIARGIDPVRILQEPKSTSTQENLAFSIDCMEAHGLTSPVVLVSNNFHLYRALQMAQTQGLEATGLGAACDWYMLPTYVLREAFALVKYRVLG